MDLGDTRDIDSRGIGALVGWHRHFGEVGIDFRLRRVGHRVLRSLEACHLDQILMIVPEGGPSPARMNAAPDSGAGKLAGQIVGLLDEALLRLDPEGRILLANPSAERLLRQTESELLGLRLADLLVDSDATPAERARIDGLLCAVSGPARGEIVLRVSEAETLYLGAVAAPVITDGRRTGSAVGLLDISELRLATEKLRASERRVRAYFNLPLVGVAVCGADMHWLEANEKFCQIVGRSRAELMRTTWRDITPSEDVEGEIALVRSKLSAADTVCYDKRYLRGDGSVVEVSLALHCVRRPDGTPDHHVCVVQDITERRRAEQERERLATAISQVAESVVITDRQGTILYVNPAFEQTTGYPRHMALGQNPRVLKSERHPTEFYREMWETITAGGVWRGRLVNRRRDGTLFTEEATISPVRDDQGEIVNFVAVKRDVTREIEMEQRLEKAQEMEAAGRVAGAVAHDFNNMLMAIRGHAEFAIDLAGPGSAARSDLQQLIETTERAGDLARQLLAFSRRQHLRPVLLQPAEVIAETLRMLQPVLGPEIEVLAVCEDGAATVRADRTQLGQVLMNLVVNARDAMPRGGTLTVRSARVEVGEGFCAPGLAPGPHVHIAVGDTGTGMDEETMRRIFEPFFTTKEKGKGTGLGLATVYGVVRQHRGDVLVESKVGEGTTFSVYLPVCPPGESA